ncbi:MAG: ABC transporter substrate-binding protein [Burkholderiaceae bacterium]|jgi:putative ABC transport system substrate-binding protein|nr:ABC transporter substrate-binding protein [Burkholderiaceae bacterium]
MRRRRLLAATVVLAAAPPLQAQTPRGVRVGILAPNLRHPGPPAIERTLAELGYTKGGNLVIELRTANDQTEAMAALAEELVRLPVDVIVAVQTPAALAARRASTTVPIVMAGIAIDPVAAGLVQSLARPGGNVTGVAGLGADLAGKAMQFMRELLPGMKRMGAMLNAADPFTSTLQPMLQQAAGTLGIELRVASVRSPDEYAPVLAAWSAARVDAAFIQPSLPQAAFVKLADAQRLPSFSFGRAMVQAGGLLSYAASQRDIAQRVAYMVDRIVKGEKPAQIPVEQPASFELSINLRSARALGLAVPQSLLLRATEVIE